MGTSKGPNKILHLTAFAFTTHGGWAQTNRTDNSEQDNPQTKHSYITLFIYLRQDLKAAELIH